MAKLSLGLQLGYGGQGMNTGLQDAVNLAWKLALVAHGNAPPLRSCYQP